jgi:tripeptide aminopeptidase
MFDTQLLYRTLSVQSESCNQRDMQRYLCRTITRLGHTPIQDKIGNIYVTKSDGTDLPYPTVIAHMDTVHTVLPHDQFTILGHNGEWFGYNPVKRQTTGIGGDDKVGIFIALTALIAFDRIKLAFFVDEEIGCQGSRHANIDFFDNSAFVIQCDRKGYGDVVQEIIGTELFGDDFKTALEPLMTAYDMRPTRNGGITDVGELKDLGLAVACTNISCGYYKPHDDDEFVVLDDVRDTTSFVLDVIQALGDTRWPHTDPYTFRSGHQYGVRKFYNPTKSNSTQLCEECWMPGDLCICDLVAYPTQKALPRSIN